MLNGKIFVVSFVVLAVLDFLWLGVVMSKFYNVELGSLARRAGDSLAPHWPSVILVYFLMALGLSMFVVSASVGQPASAALRGALFGLVVYGIYDLTNFGTLIGWSIKLTVVDILWGMTIYAIAGAIVTWIGKYLH